MNNYNYLIIIIALLLASCNNGDDHIDIGINTSDKILEKFDAQICKAKKTDDYQYCYKNWLQEKREINGKKVVCIPSLNAHEYVNALDIIHFNIYWKKSIGNYQKSRNSKKIPLTFISYSDSYLDWLTQYSITNEGKWITSYLDKYQQMKDISPSMIATFDSMLLNENLNNDKTRLVALIHHLTVSYNYCQE